VLAADNSVSLGSSDSFEISDNSAYSASSIVKLSINSPRDALLSTSLSPQLIRIEAEDMLLNNYRLESIDFASNQMVASFFGGQKNEKGSVSTVFAGTDGIYDVILGYFDEEGGGAILDPLLNGNSLGRLKLDQKLGSNNATPDTFVRRTVGHRLSLNQGDTFSVLGFEAANEHARIDYIEFVKIASAETASNKADLPEPIRINVGGDAYTDKSGQVWSADQFFEDGQTAKTDRSILGSLNDPLYQSGRYAKTMDYHIPVANGVYDLNLHFAEVVWASAGDRLFDIFVEGQSLSDRFDIYQQAGQSNKAVQKGFSNIVVTDGRLDIHLKAVKNYAQLSGIEVLASGLIDPTDVDPIDIDSIDNPTDAIRVNSGGESYIDSKGQTWLADTFFDDGWTTYKEVSIQDSNDDFLYKSERYAKTLDYSVAVANGIYDLNLLFAEIYWSNPGQRTFDIAVEGQLITQNLDIYKEVGKFKAFNQQINEIVVTDGRLDISLTGIQDKAKISGFEILPVALNSSADADAPPILPATSGMLPPGAVALSNGASVRYVSPTGRGDGSSWQQAADISELDRLIEQSSPGDEIWIAGDLGAYNMAGKSISIDSGSTADKPIYIRGVASQVGGNDTPLFVGDRAENWAPGKNNGTEVFRLLNGAKHLHFSDLDFKNIGNGAFRFGGDITDIVLEDMRATNVRRFVENYVSGSARSATVSNLTIRDVDIKGFSKSAIRLQYNSNNILIEDVVGDSQQQDGDNFAMGVHLLGTVNNVVHRRVTMKNAVQRKSDSDYWNADGFVTDWGTYNITYEDTFASGNTDGGYDLKSKDTLLVRAGAADNKRNFRIWRSATMIDVASDDPLRRGGTGTSAHINVLGNEGNLSIRGGTFSGDRGIDNIIFDLDDQGSVTVDGVVITDDLYRLYTVEKGKIDLKNVVEP